MRMGLTDLLRHTSRHTKALSAALVVMVVLCINPALSVKASHHNESAKITAAFVYNFCKFVDWPDEPDVSLTVWICGETESAGDFDSIEGKTIKRAAIEVVVSRFLPEDQPYQVVFIPADQGDAVPALLDSLAGRPVLTVSDSVGFCERGGMIELAKVQGKMKFSVNAVSAKRSNLVISSRLLKMAREVIK